MDSIFIKRLKRIILVSLLLPCFMSCSKSESYSELLVSEQKAVNWYLAQRSVEIAPPADSIFEVGADAPYYRMDSDGTIYMQVLRAGNRDNRPRKGEKVYFRFARENIKLMYEGTPGVSQGNADNMASSVGPTYFFYGNSTYPTTVQFGKGLQLPMDYLGFGSEVNLVLKSYSGFTDDQAACQPYVYNVKYYKAEY